MAKKLNVAKSDILNPEAESMAVRLALAETTIIQDTVQYLKEVYYPGHLFAYISDIYSLSRLNTLLTGGRFDRCFQIEYEKRAQRYRNNG